ncbi:HNH endonuclease [Nostoc sp. CHAB 5844]|nr:HNH endonuclease [Nostoc sp. CHAB 5844]
MRYRKKLLIERYGYQCFWCSCELTPLTLTIDHLIPLSKGGSNRLNNLRLASFLVATRNEAIIYPPLWRRNHERDCIDQ